MDRIPGRSRCHECRSRLIGSFCALDDRSLGVLDRGKSSKLFKKGQSLFHEGQVAFGIFCLRSGRVKISRASGGGKTHLLRIQTPGALLGLEDLFAGDVHNTTAEMIDEGTACFVHRAAVMEIFQHQPQAARAIASELAQIARRSERERTELTLGTVREKVARVLLDLARSHGAPERPGIRIDLPLTREEIAEMAGTAVETTIRQISAFRDEGLLAPSREALLILDAAGLAHAAHDEPLDSNGRAAAAAD
jgi:CRP/FNR family transcriptional regulator